jgi:hypothetical protein
MTALPILSETNSLQVISRKDASKLGLTHYFTGKPCINGHLSRKNMSGGCLKCCSVKQAEKRAIEAKPPRVLLSQDEKKRRKAEGDKRYRLATPLTDLQKEVKAARQIKIRANNPGRANELARKYYAANPEKFKASTRNWAEKNPDKTRAAYKNWASRNKDHLKEYRDSYHSARKGARNEASRQWKIRNPEKSKQTTADYRVKNKDQLRIWSREYKKEKINTDPLFAMRNRVRVLILNKIRSRGYTKRSRTQEILGCDWGFFKSHIERQFLKGMTWENRSEWHIDHITPMATAVDEEEVIALNHFTNLRPMWAKDNLAKGAQKTHLI